MRVKDDPSLKALVSSERGWPRSSADLGPACVEALKTTLAENLAMIEDS